MKDRIIRGCVVRSRFPEATYPKFFVIIGLSLDKETIYGFFINSDRNIKADSNKHTKCTQIKIEPKTYEYLYKSTPSYIDCYEFKETNFTKFINALIDSPMKICEPALFGRHIKEIVSAIQGCRKFSSDEKDIVLRKFELPEL